MSAVVELYRLAKIRGNRWLERNTERGGGRSDSPRPSRSNEDHVVLVGPDDSSSWDSADRLGDKA